ncbi:MAG: rod shape-determining protein RodA [bacterium]|nr:rod shape-determining protein RodA [bacterium]
MLKKFSTHGFDWILWLAVVILTLFGLAGVYSIDLSHGLTTNYFEKQALAFGLGMGFLIVAYLTQYTFYRLSAKWWYALSLLLLFAVLIFGHTIRGTKGWFVLGGFSFQPVEFAKIGLILMLAHITSQFGRDFKRPLFFVGTGLVTLLFMVLIMLQPDLGSAVLLGLVWFGLMCLIGAKRAFLLSLVILVVIGSVFSWSFLLKDYQKDRVLTFIDPGRDPLGAGYNITQSIIAIGAGRVFGRGLGFGSQSQLRFLPEAQTDFIFATIGEELGFAGTTIIILLYGVIFWRIVLLARRTNDDFISTVAAGASILLASQFFVNIGASLGLLPVTGVTLPFVSYGGSSLLTNYLLIGILESMMKRRY